MKTKYDNLYELSSEGLFKHIVGYTFSTEYNKNIVKVGENGSGFIYKTIKNCFDQEIYDPYDEWRTAFEYLGISPIRIKQSGFVEFTENKSAELIINKKYDSALKQKLSIYKIDANINNNPGGSDGGVIGKLAHRIRYNKEGIQIGQVNKILETQTKTIYEWLNEFYTVKIVESNNSEIQIRKNILKIVSAKLLPWLSQYINKHNVKGFDISKTIDAKELKKFSDGDTNELILCWYDAWKFTDDHARDSEKYEMFNNFLTKFEKDAQTFIDTQLKVPLKFTFDGGDWDDGNGYVIYKTSK